ncbi:hypothetical protein EVAR_165_1 [Eumeta japonica]|uniref:Uncharacterized protein n=1 Tax=Eumeta variegata TaxID=151549 RepID=A0A4C1SBQ7_EUMVA|nr:hypothetical protein EVAR_165_1 [Eumeta japonica]
MPRRRRASSEARPARGVTSDSKKETNVSRERWQWQGDRCVAFESKPDGILSLTVGVRWVLNFSQIKSIPSTG